MSAYHEPVLAQACLEWLAVEPEGVYVDATFGGGGHSGLILRELGDKGRLFGFDQDEDAAANVPDDPRFTFVPHNFRFLSRWLKFYGIDKVDGLLADLGVSSHQFDVGPRGFSYRFDSALDMRMNRRQGRTASDVLSSLTADELQDLFSRFGEVRNARSLAARLVEFRQGTPIRTTTDLVNAVEPLIRGKRERYLAQIFQALRMVVNDEMGALAEWLEQAHELLRPGGRLVVIAYHSIEDRMVKHFLKTGNVAGQPEKDFYGVIYRPFRLLTRKAVMADEEEIKENPRARSARLRAGERSDMKRPDPEHNMQ